jgi:hypothetical protein
MKFRHANHLPPPASYEVSFEPCELTERPTREAEKTGRDTALHHTLKELRRPFASDVTPFINRLSGEWQPNGLEDISRERECVSWLRQNRPGSRWLAIDNIDHWFRPGCSDLSLTDPTEEFLPSDQASSTDMILERLT